jgi:predicted nucleic acid-binding Zn ribbon protein
VRVSEISVTFEKRVSDGDYGSERIEIHKSAMLDSSDNPEEVLRSLLIDVRASVQADFANSTNFHVRQRGGPQVEYCHHCGDPLAADEHGMHELCRDLVEEEKQHARVEELPVFDVAVD